MRAAAAVFPDDRVRAFQAMHAEARRIQERVTYAKEIEAAMLRRTLSAELETDEEEEEEECLVVDDPDEWWRDLQDGKQSAEFTAKKPPQPRKEVLTPTEATEELLNTFRPICESVDELKRLLGLKADPNAPPPPGRISPLQHVMTFAPEQHVAAMRNLLLENGAIETKEDKEQWLTRQRADLFEPHRVRDFYEDDRHLSPCAAAMEK